MKIVNDIASIDSTFAQYGAFGHAAFNAVILFMERNGGRNLYEIQLTADEAHACFKGTKLQESQFVVSFKQQLFFAKYRW